MKKPIFLSRKYCHEKKKKTSPNVESKVSGDQQKENWSHTKKFGHGLTDSEKKELVKFQDLAGKYIQQMGPSEPAMSRHGRHT